MESPWRVTVDDDGDLECVYMIEDWPAMAFCIPHEDAASLIEALQRAMAARSDG